MVQIRGSIEELTTGVYAIRRGLATIEYEVDEPLLRPALTREITTSCRCCILQRTPNKPSNKSRQE